jgi:diguanylate cyclase (GGDEF)-like protein
MKKTKIQNILDNAHKEITNYAQESHEKDLSETVLIDFLHAFANKLIKDRLNPSTENFEVDLESINFDAEYKKLAVQSIDSYTNSTQNFEQLNSEQNDFIFSDGFKTLDTNSIKQHFNQIQSHINDEIDVANDIIGSLLKEVKKLEKKSQIDPLTKLYNRRSMDEYLSQLEHIELHGSDIHIIMVDIDDFKAVNDTYGHLVGDKVLIFLSNLLQKTLRDGDRVFRYGGEEFLLVLNRVDDEVCMRIIQRILHLVRTNKLTYQDHRISITLSIGATTYRKDDTLTTVLQRADEALYEAKNSGKDQSKTRE